MTRSFDNTVLTQFQNSLRGRLIQPGDEQYAQARQVYNAMIDKRPALIARCVDTADVMAAVNFARANNLLLAVRGGGHNGGGLGICDDGLVIDLAAMRSVHVDPEARTAQVAGGCVWGDVDHATHAFGLATPTGIISTTGVGGLTLGGGVGNLSRKYGLTIDNLLEVDLVLADGSCVTANAAEHPDLFWALRGGGGNFGVVTSFRFRLHPVHTNYAGPMIWPLARAKEIMQWYREFLPAAPDDLSGWFGFITVPAAAPFPEPAQGKKMAVIFWCYTGPLDNAEAIFRPIRTRFGAPGRGLCRSHSPPGDAKHVRRALSAGAAVVLAWRLCSGTPGRRHRQAYRVRPRTADAALHHAYVPHRRRGRPGGRRRNCVGLP